jgi:hypothetical protein
MSQDPSQQSSPPAPPTPESLEAQEQARRQISQWTEEIAQLSEADVQPASYYSDVLQRVYFATQAFAAVVWLRTPQGNLQLQCQINLREVGLDRTPDSRPLHDELLRQSAIQGRAGVIDPHFSQNFPGSEQIAGNPTDYFIILAPILQEKQVIGIMEIWLDPRRDKTQLGNIRNFLVRMAAYASLFNRNHQLRQMMGQQELWLKLESFTKQIHGSMDLTEVAYLVANEGRRLIDVDRISVATREADSCEVTAISGADVVEKRSNLVQLMCALFDAVIDWGEKLIYTGTKDDALPPKVLEALDAYLGESNSKILVVLPLQDEREKEDQRKARSALMMECFETKLAPEQLLARLDVVGRHACTALYNVQEYDRIPMRFVWLPLAYVQQGLGGKTKAIVSAVLAGVTMLICAMIFVPYPHKMESNGQFMPKERQWLYASNQGKVMVITAGLKANSPVAKGQVLMTLFDPALAKEVSDLELEIANLKPKAQRTSDAADVKGADAIAIRDANLALQTKIEAQRRLQQRTNADLARPGIFTITAPKSGILLNADFRENLLGKNVKPTDPLIHIGYVTPGEPKRSEWEIVLKIPQKHYGQVKQAYRLIGQHNISASNRSGGTLTLVTATAHGFVAGDRIVITGVEGLADANGAYSVARIVSTTEFSVASAGANGNGTSGTGTANRLDSELLDDVLPISDATRSYRAKLREDMIAPQANPQRDDANDPESVVMARARIEAIYKLTPDVFARLKTDGLPEAVAKKLHPLKGRAFPSQEIYIKAIETALVTDELARFKDLGNFDKLLADLKSDGAPQALLDKLKAARDKNLAAEAFSKEVEKAIRAEVYNRYQHMLLDHACRDDIPLAEQVPPSLLLSGGEVHTRIRCGNRAMGYSLFYGVYEFTYEKVIFPYFGW